MSITQIVGSQILDQSINTEDLAANSIDASVLKNGSISNDKIISIDAAKAIFDNTASGFTSTNLFDAIKEANAKIDNNATTLAADIATAKSELQAQITTQEMTFSQQITTLQDTVNTGVSSQLDTLSTTKATLNGDVRTDFSANSLTVAGNIVPTTNGLL